MTIPGIVQHSQTDPFDERIEITIEELELAIQWDRPSALLAVYDSEYIRMDAETALENYLVEQRQKVVRIEMDEMSGLDLLAFLQDYPSTPNCVFFISGVTPDHKSFFPELGHHLDILTNRNIRAVFWITPKMLTELAFNASDFWEYRQRVIEFLDMPNPDHILQTALESAWQGTGEYSDDFDDTEEKINLREAFLTELPENAESTSMRANLMLTLGILNWRKGNFEKANEFLQNAIKAAVRLEDNWFEAECFNAIALVKFSQGRNDEAIDSYKQALAIAPEQFFVWNNLGNLCIKIMRNDEAMLAFQKALQHNPKDPIAWNGLGTVYYRIGYIDDSINAYRTAIEYAPSYAGAWTGLGDAYASIGRDVDAIDTYQKAIELNADLAAPWLRLAEIYGRQGRNKDALKTYQRALLVEPKNHQIWNELGLIFMKVKSFGEAEQAFSKASELDRSFGWAVSNLALAYANQGKYQEAIEACHRSLEVFTEDNDKVIALDRLANFYRAINDYDKAMQTFQMADKLNGCAVPAQQESASGSSSPEPVQPSESAPEIRIPSESGQTSQSEAAISLDEISRQKQEMPAWIVQSEPWNQNCSTSVTYSDDLSWKAEPESLTRKQTEELTMKTQTARQPLRKFVSAPGFSENPFSPDPFGNEDEITETKNPEVWNEKGNIHYQNGSYDHAIAAYNKAIELDRSFGWPYSNLALTYLTLGKLTEAILFYQKSATILLDREEQAASWNSLGNIYRHLNDYENAITAYQKADELDPRNEGKREKVDLAISGPNSQNAQVWLELGNLFFKSASYNEAQNAYFNAIKLDPTSGWAQSNLAMSLVYQGKHKEAIPVYLKSIELFTDDKDKATSWNRLGNVYRKLNDQISARKAYQTAVVLSKEKINLLTRTRFTLLGNCYTN
ncbi:MAG: tetratricopeptide repeat protein [Anaerolineales bacterium]|nr:tetratricopeptide repeat protein [Anaerolineales bacterium]